jgi:hypothetical protein
MSKVVYVISTVKSTSRCSTAADSVSRELSMSELDQLKQAAEKYDQFRKVYPFEATVERRTAAVEPNGSVKRIVTAKEKFRSENWELYKPGDNLDDWGLGNFRMHLLLLSTLGDSVFWEHHCFIARGVESYQGTRVVRLEFSPTTDVRGPDYEGAALLDSATSYLLRVDFRLANPDPGFGPRKLNGYITFMSPSPFVMVPDTTTAIWWVHDSDTTKRKVPDVAQRLHVEEIKYPKATPPGFEKAKQ